MNVFFEERSGKTGIFSETGQEKSVETSPKNGTKLRVGRASASKFPPTKIDKTPKNWNIYTEIQNCYSKNPNSESSKNATKADQKAKQSTQSETTTKTI